MVYRSRHEQEERGMEHSASYAVSRVLTDKLGMRYSTLDSSIRSYVDNIIEQMTALVRSYGFKNPKEFMDHIPVMDDETTIPLVDVKRFEQLMNCLQFAMKENKIPKEDERVWKEREEGVLEQVAIEILGAGNVFASKAIEQTFGTKLETTDIPRIPFSKEELERAKELNQFLVLRIDKAPDGQPLTMKKMGEILTPKFQKNNKGKIFFNTNWYSNESFYTKETPQVRWQLVSKEILPNSINKNYIDQTQTIVDYLTNEVFKDQQIPEPYLSAILEFESKKGDLTNRLSSNWRDVARELESLQISYLTRQTPAEAIYDSLIRFNITNKRHLPDHWAWTRRCRSDGILVDVGNANLSGLNVNGWSPDSVDLALGALLSR